MQKLLPSVFKIILQTALFIIPVIFLFSCAKPCGCIPPPPPPPDYMFATVNGIGITTSTISGIPIVTKTDTNKNGYGSYILNLSVKGSSGIQKISLCFEYGHGIGLDTGKYPLSSQTNYFLYYASYEAGPDSLNLTKYPSGSFSNDGYVTIIMSDPTKKIFSGSFDFTGKNSSGEWVSIDGYFDQVPYGS
jgi:hypothetical protein